MLRGLRWKLLLLALVVIVGAGVLFACSQTPTSVPIRTFERAQRVDTICLKLSGPNAPTPQPAAACAPVPSDVNGINLDNQLFALVTQSSRGEVAVVDLSAGQVVDRSKAVPGINFLPVGAIPTDIAATPDGRMAFVASAEPNKFAIYGIPGHRILGDFISLFTGAPDPEGPITLGSWPVCTLPQRPGSLTVVPRGTLDDLAAYELVAVLPGSSTDSAKIVTIDPKPFLRASPHKLEDGGVEEFGAGDRLVPGEPVPCAITGATEIAGSTLGADGGAPLVPTSFTPGARWDDGVKWVDGGVDLRCEQADLPLRCGGRPCGCPATVVGPDGGASEDAGACQADAGDPSSAPVTVDHGPLDPPLPIAIARDDKTIFVADDGLPLVHVFDLSVPGNPVELPPFVVSSVIDPDRVATVRDIAISPPTRDYKRFLYAVDRKDGTIAVFDVTDVATASRTPMRRPHPELNPFQPEDRLAFGSPVVAVAFARHDWPLTRSGGATLPASQTGVLCNPNPRVEAVPNPVDYGASYRANSQDTVIALSPARLRGIFAFATLANGQIVAIDVDDWDAPCRRPQELVGPSNDNGVAVSLGALAVKQPEPAEGDFDPYHAPRAAEGSVTQEIFFPVSAPHRIRSTFYLRNDSVSGNHVPFLVSQPQIQGTGAPLPQTGPGSESTPKLRPTTALPGISVGTEDIGIRFSIDTPDVHFDQDWTVQYEGPIPGFQGLPAPLTTTDDYNSLVLTQEQAKFCAKGVEDWTVGGERALAVTNALRQAGRALPPEPLERRMMDYVQIVDELLPATDEFWSIKEDPNDPQACFVTEPSPGVRQLITDPADRYNTCASYFGTAAQQSGTRDFPILEAYDDHLVLGRFGKTTSDIKATREAIYADPSNRPFMRLARCCFHKQVSFAVRGGAQWVTFGSTLGFMSHLTTDTNNRCVASCDARNSLLNARVPSLPYTPNAPDFAPHRDTPLAMRNPAFSFFIQNGFSFDPATQQQVNAQPTRDTFYHFSTRGQFTPLIIDLAGGTGSVSVNPQSMRFIESLGQIAVVDGAAQGLVLIDLSLVGIARAPYF
ncbi:MAG: hypothetical protein U0270_40065 [Labilithrix sp.]